MDYKGLIQRALYSRWRPSGVPADGYSIIMPIPEDMPFLLRLALEGIKHIDTTNCSQVTVVGDGWGDDGGAALKEIVRAYGDTRTELVLFSRRDRAIVRHIPSPHWLTVLYGTNHARHRYAFLHDADAFFLKRDCMERTYAYCKNRDMHAVGVTARWDPFFKSIEYQIPGTWQMMFSTSWLRSHYPYDVRGRLHHTPHGANIFDTLLYPQYLDYSSGKVGIMENPPEYAHFNGTVVTYRAWRRAKGRQVIDELFRLLLLSMLEHMFPPADSQRLLPSIPELARGLTDPTTTIRYDPPECARNYGEFRNQVIQMCEADVFRGLRANQIGEMLAPFDRHYALMIAKAGDALGPPVHGMRKNGLATPTLGGGRDQRGRRAADWKGFIQRRLYARWKSRNTVEDGYSILMPMPEDMPFLLRLAMEGISSIDTSHCRQIIVIGDGCGDDRCAAIRRVLADFADPRVEVCAFPLLHRAVARRMSCPHPLTIIFGTNVNRCDFAFLHDADAFFLKRDCVERMFAYCSQNHMNAVGVTARWDPFFQKIGYTIPGTWQMMFSVPWLRTHKPWKVHGRLVVTPHGPNIFDTLLYPQYLDYGKGRIGVMPDPPKYVHFNGTIVTYRAWRRAGGKPVVDELFRLLLLSVLEHVLSPVHYKRLLPSVDELSYGLTNATCPIRYDTLDCARNYSEFRTQVKELCGSPVFTGERAQTIDSLLRPFDEHFAEVARQMGDKLGAPVHKFRRSGLAGSEV